MCVLVALPGWASVGRYVFKPESAAAGKPQPEPQDSARTGGKPRAQLGVARQLWEAADNGSPGPGPAPFPFLISLVVFLEAPPPHASAKPCAFQVFHPGGRAMTSRPAVVAAASPLRSVGWVRTARAVGGWGCGVDASGIGGAGAGRTGPGEKGGARAREGRAAAAYVRPLGSRGSGVGFAHASAAAALRCYGSCRCARPISSC